MTTDEESNRIKFLIQGRTVRGASFEELAAILEQEAAKHLPAGPHIVLGEMTRRERGGGRRSFLAVHVLEEVRFTPGMLALLRSLEDWISTVRDVALTWRRTCTRHRDCREHGDLGRACYNERAPARPL